MLVRVEILMGYRGKTGSLGFHSFSQFFQFAAVKAKKTDGSQNETKNYRIYGRTRFSKMNFGKIKKKKVQKFQSVTW